MWRRVLFWLPLGALLVVALAVAFRPQPLLVEAAVVDRGPLAVTIEADATTRAREVYEVSAPVAGRLLRLDLEVGDTVEAFATVVARIRPTAPALLDVRTRRELEARLNAAEAGLTLAGAEKTRAEAEVGFAISELDRAERLVRRGTIASAALERAQLEVRTAQARLASAQADLAVKSFEVETVKARLIEDEGLEIGTDEPCCIELKAPVDGVVLRLLQESERVVDAGAPLIEIGDPLDLEVVVDVLSRDAVRLDPGARVELTNWGGTGPLAGRIERIEPFAFTEVSALGIEEQRVNVVVALTDPPDRWRRLGHGFRLDASLVVWADDDVVRVPVTSLFRDAEGAWRVFRVEHDRAQSVVVRTGHMSNAHAEVVAGLEDGDTVVRFPTHRVHDGARLALRRF